MKLARLLSAMAILSLALNPSTTLAQCGVDEAEITMTVYTDAWGYEIYWELLPGGNTCGDGTYAFGGNDVQVGCDGAGNQDATGGNGYASNSSFNTDPVCVPIDQPVTLQFIDDWGDGGMTFEVFIDGQFIGFFVGQGSATSWTFNPSEIDIPLYDEPCGASEMIIDGGPVLMNNENAIAALNEISPGGGNCSLQGVWCEGNVTNSVWAYFVAPESGGVQITTCMPETVFDTQIALWKGDDCSDQSAFELISANDDSGCGQGNFFASNMYAACLEPGATYYVQIDGWAGATGDLGVEVNSYNQDPDLAAYVNSMPCAVNKGEPGTGSILPYFIGYGSNFDASWSGPGGFSSSSINIYDLDAGEYTLEATTDCGEVFTETYTIAMPAPMSLSLELTQPLCPESGDGMAVPNVSGGSAPYQYEWEGPNDFLSAEMSPENLNAGSYTLTVTDNNGCVYTQNVTMISTNDVGLDLGANMTICLDDTEVLYGPVGYNYTWQDGSNNQFFVVDGEVLGEGQFSFVLTVSNEAGCEATDAVQVVVENCNSVDESTFRDLKIWPVPADQILNVSGLPQDAGIQIFDATGRIVTSINDLYGIGYINTGALATGSYIIVITTTEATSVHRIEVSH